MIANCVKFAKPAKLLMLAACRLLSAPAQAQTPPHTLVSANTRSISS